MAVFLNCVILLMLIVSISDCIKLRDYVHPVKKSHDHARAASATPTFTSYKFKVGQATVR